MFVTNLKLMILGIGAMLATALVFSVIGEIVTRPQAAEPQPLSQVTVRGTKAATDTPEVHPSRTPVARAKSTQPVLQLTLPTRTFTETAIPTSQATPQPYPPPSLATSEPYPLPNVATLNPYPPPEETSSITATARPTSTATLLATPVLGSSAIQGRILFQRQVLDEPVLLNLENQDLFTVQQITSPPGGEYTVFDLLPSAKGYSILFSQDINPGFRTDQVVRWGLVRTSPVLTGEMTGMPDLEISLLGLGPVTPLPDAQLTNGPITLDNPLRFEWSAYPAADQYWVELRLNRLSAPVWDSGFIDSTTVNFDGTLWSGATIQPGTYWWSVGVRVDEQAMTISSPVWEFDLDW
jgi:hypothetical protein